MSDALQTYRLYRLNAFSGEIQSVEELDAYFDDQAIGRALEEAGDDRTELCRGDRKLVAVSGGNGPSELRIAPPGA